MVDARSAIVDSFARIPRAHPLLKKNREQQTTCAGRQTFRWPARVDSSRMPYRLSLHRAAAATGRGLRVRRQRRRRLRPGRELAEGRRRTGCVAAPLGDPRPRRALWRTSGRARGGRGCAACRGRSVAHRPPKGSRNGPRARRRRLGGRSHRRSKSATRAAASYLDELHAGAEERLGLGLGLACCIDGQSPTSSLTDMQEALTRPLPRSRAAEAGETWSIRARCSTCTSRRWQRPKSDDGGLRRRTSIRGRAKRKKTPVAGKDPRAHRARERRIDARVRSGDPPRAVARGTLGFDPVRRRRRFAYAPALGPPWATLGEVRLYAPWGWIVWGRLYASRAPTLFRNAGAITTLAALAGAGASPRWRPCGASPRPEPRPR